jgi:hypothetical protein
MKIKNKISFWANGLIAITMIFSFVFFPAQFSIAGKSKEVGSSKDNTPPNISIIYPENGNEVSGVVVVKTEASDNAGVTKVEFFVDGNKLFTDGLEPYEFVWNTVAVSNGNHILFAKAYDRARNVEISNSVEVLTRNTSSVITSQIKAEMDYIVNAAYTEENINFSSWNFLQSEDDIYGAINANRAAQGENPLQSWVRVGEGAMAAVGMMQGAAYLYESGFDIGNSKYDFILDKYFLSWELAHSQGQNNDITNADYGAFMDRIYYNEEGNYANQNPNWKTDVTAQMMIANWKYYEYNIKINENQIGENWLVDAWPIQQKAADYLVKMHDTTPAGAIHLLPGNSNESEYGTWIHFAANAVPALRSASVWAKEIGVSYDNYDRIAEDLLIGIHSMKDPARPNFFKYRPYIDGSYGNPTYGDSIDQLTFVPYETGAVSPDIFAGQISDWWTNGDWEIKMTYQTKKLDDWRYYGTRWHFYFDGRSENSRLIPGAGFQLAKIEWKYGRIANNSTYINRSQKRLAWGKELKYSSLWWYNTSQNEANVSNGFQDWRDAENYSNTAESWARFVDSSAYFIEVLLMNEAGIDTDYNPKIL